MPLRFYRKGFSVELLSSTHLGGVAHIVEAKVETRGDFAPTREEAEEVKRISP